MADLGELHDALRRAVEDGAGHKVFFYAAGKNGAGLRHGFIAVVDADTCQVNFEQLDSERALSEIAALQFIKVQALRMLDQNPATGSNPLQNTRHVLNQLDPALQPGREPSPVAGQVTTGRSLPESDDAQAPALVTEAQPSDRDPAHARLKEQATALLQTYYGNSAAQKVADIAARHPPLTEPVVFLDACRQLAALLVGALKANEVFKDLYDTL